PSLLTACRVVGAMVTFAGRCSQATPSPTVTPSGTSENEAALVRTIAPAALTDAVTPDCAVLLLNAAAMSVADAVRAYTISTVLLIRRPRKLKPFDPPGGALPVAVGGTTVS